MGVFRYGVCSGWLSRLGQEIMSTTDESSVDPPRHQEQVNTRLYCIILYHDIDIYIGDNIYSAA